MTSLDDLPLHREKDPAEVNLPEDKNTTAWRCQICGHVHYGEEAPEQCPYCFFPKAAFKKAP